MEWLRAVVASVMPAALAWPLPRPSNKKAAHWAGSSLVWRREGERIESALTP